MSPRPSSDSPYSVHPSVEYARSILENLPEKTGKSVDQWVRVVRKSGPKEEKEIRTWLKTTHGLGMTTAVLIADRSLGKQPEAGDAAAYLQNAAGYVEAQYAGAKSDLRPIRDALLELGRSLGRDIRVCPCKTMIPIYRTHVIAEIKPATRTRVDFGLALRGASPKPIRRLIDTGGLARKDRITHRFALAKVAEVDDQVKRWLKIAYELDG